MHRLLTVRTFSSASLASQKQTLVDESKRTLLTRYAEAENLRKHREAQLLRVEEEAALKFASSLVEIAGKIIAAGKLQTDIQLSKNVKIIGEGITMAVTAMRNSISKHGLDEYTPSIGDRFDSSLMKSSNEMPTISHGTIVRALAPGWTFRTKLLLRAVVVIE